MTSRSRTYLRPRRPESAPEDSGGIRIHGFEQRCYVTVRMRFGIREPSLVAVAAVERPNPCVRVVSELCDLEAAPLGPVAWMPRCSPLDKRDRVASDDELEANLVADMLRDAALAEPFELADGG